MSEQLMTLGHLCPLDYQAPKGDCAECGGTCDDGCGRHTAGCIYGGFGYGYWIYAEDCPLDHGPETCTVDHCCS